jgi:hypothetical protein
VNHSLKSLISLLLYKISCKLVAFQISSSFSSMTYKATMYSYPFCTEPPPLSAAMLPPKLPHHLMQHSNVDAMNITLQLNSSTSQPARIESSAWATNFAFPDPKALSLPQLSAFMGLSLVFVGCHELPHTRSWTANLASTY